MWSTPAILLKITILPDPTLPLVVVVLLALAILLAPNCASDTNHDTRFTHVIGFNFVTNPNYDVINTLSVHNSISTKNINNLSEPELEIGSSSFIPNIVYGNSSAIAAGTNCTSTPGNLTTIEFSDLSKLCRNYIIVDDHKFGVCLIDNAGSMGSASFKHATESKDILDAKEPGILKYFSRVHNLIDIKGARLNFHSNSNILFLNFDIIAEAELSDVMKFATSSGAVNQFS